MDAITFLRSKGYPLRMKANDKFDCKLIGIQWLLEGDYTAVYQYKCGDNSLGAQCCHDLWEITEYPDIYQVIEQ